MSSPRVSVVMPVLNPDPRFLARAVESVMAQTLEDWELIVVEDPPASDAEFLLPKDDRIRWIHRERRTTLADALNHGIAEARGEFVARLDSDDLCLPNRLERQLEALLARPGLAVIGTSIDIINDEGAVIGRRALPSSPEEVARAMRRFNAVAHPSVMFRKQAVTAVGGYRSMGYAEDYDLWCRLIRSGTGVANLPEPLVQYRFHEGALKRDAVHTVIRETIAIKRRYFRDEFTFRDHLRIAGELTLTILPPRFVVWLFGLIEYGTVRS